MNYFIFKNSNNFTKFIIIVFTVFLCSSIFFSIISLFFDVEVVQKDLANNIGLAKLMQSLYTVFFFLVPCLLINYMIGYNLFNFTQSKNNNPLLYLLATLCIVSILPIINLVAEWNSQLKLPESFAYIEELIIEAEKTTEKTMMLFLQVESLGGLAINIIVIALLPALAEEFLFRGILQKYIINTIKNPHIGIIIASFIFSFIHFQFFGFLPRLLLGIALGYFYLWSKNILVPSIAHFFNNSLAVVYFYVLSQNGKIEEIESLDIMPIPFYWVIISILLSSVLYYLFYQNRKDKKVRTS